MAYTLGDITTKVQQRIRDNAFSTGEITNYLNDTLNDIYNEYRLPFMQDTADYLTTAEDPDITSGVGLPAFFSQAINLTALGSGYAGVIPYIDYDVLDEMYPNPIDTGIQPAGRPQYWYMYGQEIFLFPVPDAGYGLRLRYYKHPAMLSSPADEPALPDEFEEILILGASYRIMQVKDNYDQAAVLENKYDELLQKLVVRYSVPQVGTPLRMRTNRHGLGKAHF